MRIGSEADSPIKIGFSDNVRTRRLALCFKWKTDIEILGVLPGGRPEEAELHRRFLGLRLKRREFFRPDKLILSYICEHATPLEDLEASSGRRDVATRMDKRLVLMAKQLAAYRGILVAELLSGIIEEPLSRAYAVMLRDAHPNAGEAYSEET